MKRWLAFTVGAVLLAVLVFGSVRGSARTDTLADDVMLDSLSTAEKVGQLFLLGFEGPGVNGADPVIGELRAGGIALLSNATSADSARFLTTALQTLAADSGTLPPLVAIDHEGGLVQRIKQGTTVFGPAFEVGQIEPLDRAVAEAQRRGDIHGRELAAMGVHMSLGPVLDVWDNPANEVIGNRSFSSSATTAAALGSAYIAGLQSQSVLAVGKPFSGTRQQS